MDGLNTRIAHIIKERNEADAAIKTSGYRDIINKIFDNGVKQLNDLEVQFLNMIDNLPQNKPSNKRFIDILGAFLGGAALSMATYNNYKIHQLNDDIQNLKDQHNLLVDLTQIQGEHLKEINAQLLQMEEFWSEYFTVSPALMEDMVNNYYKDIKNKFEILADTVHSAIDGKLSNLLLSAENAKLIVNKVKEMAAMNHAKIPLRENADLFHQEISYLFDSKNLNFILLVHIPLVSYDMVFKLQKYTPFPFVFNDKTVIPTMDKDILATNYDQAKIQNERKLHFVTSEDEMRTCKKIGDNYFCNGRDVYLLNKNRECVGALHNRDIKQVIETCQLTNAAEKEVVVKINQNTWGFYTPKMILRMVKCQHSFEELSVQGFNFIRLPTACSFELVDHLIQSNKEQLPETSVLMLKDWDLNITETWPTIPQDLKTQLQQNAEKLHQIDRNLTMIHDNLEKTKIPVSYGHMPLGVAWTALIAIVIIAFAFCIYLTIRKIRQRAITNGTEIRTDSIPTEDQLRYEQPTAPGPFANLSHRLADLARSCQTQEPAYLHPGGPPPMPPPKPMQEMPAIWNPD